MHTPVSYLFLLPLVPLIGAFVNGIFGYKIQRRWGKGPVHAVAVAASVATFAISLFAFFSMLGNERVLVQKLWEWMPLSGGGARLQVDLAFLVDHLSALMLLVVTGVGSLIHVFSMGYMQDEKPYWRYFSYLNLFLAMMLVLVLGENLFVTFIGWEGVGLASYLLIGFYYEEIPKAQAGMKAFIVNRIGDFGFVVGVAMIFWALGGAFLDAPGALAYAPDAGGFHSLSYTQIAEHLRTPGFEELLLSRQIWGLPVIHVSLIFIFLGACGKSAQIPLYVWLPDAMAGPTPVSALIHAATMVTAGVYLVVRLSFLYALSPVAMTVVACVGALTALFAATMGLFQTDLKKVLAYSTVSQLGYMFLAAGVGAFSAAIFHVMTHAFFKACLFLGSGAIIYAMHHKQEMKDMGGLRKILPVTYATFLVSTLAITGIPGLSGFFSKDEILWKTFDSANLLIPGEILWGAGALAALGTSFYMFRLVYQTFSGEPRADAHTLGHAREYRSMSFPLIVLAGLALVAGYIGLPEGITGTHSPFETWLHPVLAQGTAHMEWKAEVAHGGLHSHTGEFVLMGISVLLAFLGWGVARRIYKDRYRSAEEEATLYGPRLHRLIFNKYYIDEIYGDYLIRPTLALFRGVAWIDRWVIDGVVNLSAWVIKVVAWGVGSIDARLVDGLVDGLAEATAAAALRVRRVQTGRIQHYVLGLVTGAAVLILVAYLI